MKKISHVYAPLNDANDTTNFGAKINEIIDRLNDVCNVLDEKLEKEEKVYLNRFEIKNDEIIDHQTGLVWERCVRPVTWQQAQDYAMFFEGNWRSWRLPTMQELVNLVDYLRFNPSTSFPEMPSKWFWSSTVFPGDNRCIYCVSFKNGTVLTNNNKLDGGFVRFVREIHN